MYKLSIIIPVFNTKKELPHTLDSIIKQTMDFREIEVIMVNDGSTDGSDEVMESYSKKYNNFKSIHLEKNCGSPGTPRNIGMLNATSEYIMFQDSDDIYTPYACEYLYNTIVEHNADIVGGLMTHKDSEGNDCIPIESWANILTNISKDYNVRVKKINELFNKKELEIIKIDSIDDNVSMVKDHGFTTKIFKKSFLKNYDISFPAGLKGGEDAVFLFHSLISAKGIILINKIVTQYDTNREGRNKSLTHDRSFETIISRIIAYNDLYKLSIKYNKKEMFIKNLLFVKMNYWLQSHLFYPHNLTDEEIILILKTGQKLFEECANNLNARNDLYFISEHVKNRKYDEALKIINEKRIEHSPFLISIIIPVFNVEKYLSKAFESIYNQTIGFENIEVIFVDDCSTDGSFSLMQNYSEKYDNVKAIRLSENSGAAGKPRNIGVKHSNAKYLMFLDPDDSFTNNACEILYNKINEEKADIVSGLYDVKVNGKFVVPPGYIKNTFTSIEDDLKVREKQTKEILGNPNFELKLNSYKDKITILGNFAFWTKIYNKEFLIKNNITFPENIISQDAVFLFNSILNAKKIVYINNIILHYDQQRVDGEKSVTNQLSKKRIMEMIESFYLLYDISKNKNETDNFAKYLLINKLSYLLDSQIYNSKLTNKEKYDILKYAQDLFKLCIKFKEIIPNNRAQFNLIANNLDESIKEINNIIDKKRANGIISVIIPIDQLSSAEATMLIDMLLKQNYKNLEIICIYTTPKNNLFKLIKEKDNDKISFIQNISNNNWIYEGLISSTGQYIHFINKFVELKENFYETFNKKVKNEDMELFLCNFNNEGSDSITQLQSVLNKDCFKIEDLYQLSGSYLKHYNLIYKTTFVENYFRDSFKNNSFEETFCYNYYLNSDEFLINYEGIQ